MSQKKKSKIFLAGHRGLIGSAILKSLIKDGYSNITTKSRDELDLTDAKKVDDFFLENNFDIVILSAGKVGGILENSKYPADFILTNLSIQSNIFASSLRNKIGKLFFFGSSCMYPKESEQPMKEDLILSGRLEESSLPYAISKLAGLQTCLALNKQLEKTIFIPIIPNSVYGENDNFDPGSGHVLSALISRFHKAKLEGHDEVELWGTGKPRREFLYSQDLADAIVLLINQKEIKVKLPINIGSGIDFSINELADKVANLVGFKGKILWDRNKPDGTMRKLLDSSRIQSLGWEPKTDIDKGILLTYKWYLKHYEG